MEAIFIYHSIYSFSISSGTLKNIDSARVSFPSQLKLREDNFYTWRTDLVNSEQYWKG